MIKAKPNDLDFSALHTRMQWYVDKDILPFCNTLVMQGTDVVDVNYYGSVERPAPAPDAIFRMHSSTKIATSVAAMILHEEGQFALDDPLEYYLPEFGNPKVLIKDATDAHQTEAAQGPIRIKHVLSHSAGLSYGFMEPNSVIDKAYTTANVSILRRDSLTLASLCDKISKLPLAYQPGTCWRYSFATDVAARLVEVLSGQRFDTFLKERLFSPLAMHDTDFWVPVQKQNRITTMYAPTDPMRSMVPGLTPIRETFTDGPPAFLSGGGGLLSTLMDYLTFVRMLVNHGEWKGIRILRPETLDLMRTNQLAEGVGVRFPLWRMPNTTFGLGFALKEAAAPEEPKSAIGEYHWGGMAGTHLWMAPQANVAGMCMTQRMPGFWHPFSRDFKRLAYQIAA